MTMENLFLYTLNELEGNLGYLMTDPFASHTLRVLLLVLSGRPLSGTITTSLYKSKKKENISVMARNANVNALMTTSRTVPDSFLAAVDKIISDIVLGLDTTTLRALATHPIGNPILQLMLELELSSSGKQKAKKRDSLFRKLIPDEKAEEDNLFSFVKNLAYDAVGSRLLEVIIRFAPGKTFRSLYSTIFKGKLDVFAKNDIAGFVVIQLLNRLSKEDLMHAVEQLCPQIGLLVERSRTSIITTLIERCRVRKVNTGLILDALQEAYGTDPARRLLKILQFDVNNTSMMAEDRKMQFENQAVGSVHGSLLAQSMLDTPGQLRELIIDGLLTTETSTLISMSKDRSASHVLQSSLAYSDQSHKFRRILIQRFFGHLRDLGTHSIASHVVDAFWAASVNLPFIRERVAIELQENEIELRESFAGKVVWRNWMMDKYKTRKSEWMAEARRNDEGGKSGLELARERFAAVSGKGSTKKRVKTTRRIQTGANDVVVGTETIH